MEMTIGCFYTLDYSSFFMLAISAAGARALSDRLDSDGAFPHYWFNDEWPFCIPYCGDQAAFENSSWTRGKEMNSY
jgi:hypothetical protein